MNLGIKVGINEMVAAAQEHGADAIGMSGLLVKSTLIIRENLVELNERALADIPVLLGGATLTRTYVSATSARCTKAASSMGGTPSKVCAPWTGWWT